MFRVGMSRSTRFIQKMEVQEGKFRFWMILEGSRYKRVTHLRRKKGRDRKSNLSQPRADACLEAASCPVLLPVNRQPSVFVYTAPLIDFHGPTQDQQSSPLILHLAQSATYRDRELGSGPVLSQYRVSYYQFITVSPIRCQVETNWWSSNIYTIF